jgi:hypothetical protein
MAHPRTTREVLEDLRVDAVIVVREGRKALPVLWKLVLDRQDEVGGLGRNRLPREVELG